MPVRSICGAAASRTEAGLPESMTPRTSGPISGILLKGWISQYTFSSRTLRPISCVTCEPKSRMSIFSVIITRRYTEARKYKKMLYFCAQSEYSVCKKLEISR